MSKIRLAIGLPAYGGVISAHHARMWLEIGNTLGASSGPDGRFELVEVGFMDTNPVDRARNLILAAGYAKQADWVFMIDSDTWIEPSATDRAESIDAGFLMLRMISDAARLDAAIVAAPVMTRRLGAREHMVYVCDEASTNPGKLMPVDVGKLGRGMTRVDAAATACIAINLARCADANAAFKFTDTLSEDLEFCRQVREAGGKIFVDPRVRTAHLGRALPIYST